MVWCSLSRATTPIACVQSTVAGFSVVSFSTPHGAVQTTGVAIAPSSLGH